jgi:hypothetical protein
VQLNHKFFKQENTGMWWGGFKAIISSASSYASWVSMAMQALTLYYVAKSGIPIWVFAIVAASFVLTVFVFEWKITIPSAMKFTNSQQYKHDNPIRRDLEEIKEQNKKIMDKLGIK